MSCNSGLNRIAVLAIVTAGMLAGSLPSHAYRMIQVPGSGRYTSSSRVTCDSPGGFVHWWTTTIPFRLVGSSSAFRAAMTTWNNVSGASHTLVEYSPAVPNNPDPIRLDDGINSIGVMPTSGLCSGSCLAITALSVLYDAPGHEIQEADIAFAYSDGSLADFQTVATHEFGHALGIHHTEVTTTPRPTMYTDYFGTDGRTLESDDMQALRCSEDWYVSPAYEGFHEATSCREIKGWARNSKRPNGAATVKIRYDNLSWDDVVANLPRSDVGSHGYSKAPKSSVKDGRYHTIRVEYPDGTLATGSPQSLICQVGIFKNQTPSSFIDTEGKKWSVGNEFHSTIPGYVTHLRYYKAAEEAGIRTLKLWTDTGQLLGSVNVDFGPAGAAGWKTGKLPGNGVWILADVEYVVTVTTEVKQSKTPCGFASPITNGPIVGTGGGYVEGDGIFPTNGSCSNFWTDIYFDM